MSSLPYHKPICWELFRNEPLEVQNRRAAIVKSRALANRERKPDNGLWWDAQKHVDQVVPAEFINPSEIDTKTYRYQVFARPSPLQCPPTCLNEVTDGPQPIRYDIKRVAVDKPFPPASFECAGHWSKHPFIVQRNKVHSDGQDCSKNNNTKSTAPTLSYNHKSRDKQAASNSENEQTLRSDQRPSIHGDFTLKNVLHETFRSGLSKASPGGLSAQCRGLLQKNSRCESKESVQMDDNNNRECRNKPVESESHQIKRMVKVCPVSQGALSDQPKLNAQTNIDDGELKNKHNDGHVADGFNRPHFSRSQSSVHACSEDGAPQSASSICNNYTAHAEISGKTADSQSGRKPPRLSTSRQSQQGLGDNPVKSTRTQARNDNHWCRNTLEKTTDIICNAGNASITKSTSPQSLANLHKHQVDLSQSNSSLSSRAGSVCSNTTLSSSRGATARKLSTSDFTPLSLHSPLSGINKPSGRNQVGPEIISSSGSNDNVASLLSHRTHISLTSPAPMAGPRQGEFAGPKYNNGRESVASLLSNYDSNNNAYESVVELESGALQDMFADLVSPSFPHISVFSNTSQCNCICDRCFSPYHKNDNLCEKTMRDRHNFATPQDTHKVSCQLCTNNNASLKLGDKSGRYILRCCPISACGTKNQRTYEADDRKLLCTFHGKQPRVPYGGPIVLGQVKPIDPVSWKVKNDEIPQEFLCRPVTSCATGETEEGSAGPLMVCEPTRPKTPEIGYGTYKLVGGVQRRDAPPANVLADLKLPPDLEEYREFTKRCPNYHRGRYDRRDPLNEMLLPSNKSTVLMRGSDANPFMYSRMPKRASAPLFQPVKTSSDLSWSLPTFAARQ